MKAFGTTRKSIVARTAIRTLPRAFQRKNQRNKQSSERNARSFVFAVRRWFGW